MKFMDGGVCAAQGFTAAGIHVGVKTNNPNKKDVALIASDTDCAAAAVYTKNIVKAAPLLVTRAHLQNGRARAVIANSGNANACTPDGEENAARMCKAAASALGAAEEDVLVASTGVIGQTLPIGVITDGVPELAKRLSADGSGDAAAAIMTTDTVKKEVAEEFEVGGKTARLGGIAKGSGMIHPNMGTMLCFLTTDCAVSAAMLQKALVRAARVSFNRISVDGDTSTNDMCAILANGKAGNAEITTE
ncbi:MAG: bifunctional ornithine acetyltransferase/N-acetylglutamate synthase, partial [Oscillospiraceae bacterium]|nr:bifunctional ornithine acetyltransferase/N-acetylglutamate synthase [Oscillospiraceae bacterium]